MTKDNNIEMGAVCLFSGMAATWWRMKPSEDPTKKGWRQQPQVTVMAAEATDENGHTPASSVNISGAEALHALRSAIDEALKYEMPKTDDADGWKQKCDLLEMDRDVVSRQLVASEQGKRKISEECDALFAEIDRLKIENAKHIGALLAIADWNNVWGPFPGEKRKLASNGYCHGQRGGEGVQARGELK